MGCINQTEVKAVDTHNEEGDHFLGTAACIDTEVISYNITCYVSRDDEDGRTKGMVYLNKDEDTGIETTTYDLYLTSEGWTAHFTGETPIIKYSLKGMSEFSQEAYIESPAYSVACIDCEIIIFHNEVEGFELL